jgi:ribosome-binding protein aMBF1 (putative translation factor)
MSNWMQCDCCGRMTNRLHKCVAYGLDTAACDDCYDYDAEAYDEAPALYLEEAEQ